MRRASFASKRWTKTAAAVAMTVLAFSQTGAKLLADTSTVFSFGANLYGQTGQGTDTGFTLIATPIDMTSLTGKNIVEVEAGGRHSLLLADDGTVFSFGSNDGGQTGLGTNIGVTLAPTPIDTTNLAGKKITQMAAGFLHNLLLAEDGSVFSFGGGGGGVNGLGYYPDTEVVVAMPIDATPLGGRRIKQVAAGNQHSFLLAEDGTVFSFGANEHGQLGLGTDGSTMDSTPTATPIVTTNLAGKTITEVAAGGAYSLLLADDGTVFSFGLNISGQTGLGTSSGWTTVATPIVTTNLAGKKITHVAAHVNGNTSLLLAEDGTVFGFGYGGKTGVGNVPDVLIATPIDTTNLAGKTMTQIATGGELSLLLADDGTVFSVGDNFANGIGMASGWTYIATAIDTTNLADVQITGISAGTNHSLLLADSQSGLPGDFNANGTVDAADYVVWRKNGGPPADYNQWRAHFGETTLTIPGDFNNDGSVDAADYVVWRRNDGSQAGYNTWRTNFGRTAGSGSAGISLSQAAVPEPGSAILLLLLMMMSLLVCQRRLFNLSAGSAAIAARV